MGITRLTTLLILPYLKLWCKEILSIQKCWHPFFKIIYLPKFAEAPAPPIKGHVPDTFKCAFSIWKELNLRLCATQNYNYWLLTRHSLWVMSPIWYRWHHSDTSLERLCPHLYHLYKVGDSLFSPLPLPFVSMYVCIYVRTYVCMYVCTYVCRMYLLCLIQ